MSLVITGQHTVGIKLTAPSDNPVTVAQNASVVTNGSSAIYGNASTAWSVTNEGTLSAHRYGIKLAAGGTIENVAGAMVYTYNAFAASIAGSGTIINAGTMEGSVYAGAGSRIENSGTIISGYGGVGIVGGAAASVIDNSGYLEGNFGGVIVSGNVTVLNSGTIESGPHGQGVELGGGSALINTGTVVGVYVDAGANVLNAAGGTIGFGNFGGVYVGVGLVGGALTNLGTVTGGVDLSGIATVLNRASGLITGIATYAAVGLYRGSGVFTNGGTVSGGVGVLDVSTATGVTITNAGTIIGTNGTAVELDGVGSRLIIDPGAGFVGQVNAGGTNNVLELAAAGTPGHLRGLGTSFTNFATIEVDASAHWSLAGRNTLESGSTLELAGRARLAITGLVEANGTVTLAGPGKFEGYGTVGIDAHSVLNVAGDVETRNIAFLSGGSETLAIETSALPSGDIAGFGATVGNSIDLAGEVVKSLSYHELGSAHGVLTITWQDGTLGTLRFAGGNYKSSQFHYTVTAGGTNITFG